jgi:catechol 2,3-dioxygenase-like lactoylglutathione lyase family enzyme
MPRGLDHIAHAVRDLDNAADFYRRIGFTVGARNRHPWGTHNCIVQFPGFFIEILTLAEPDKLGDDGFSKLFGKFNGDFLKEREGFSLLLLESRDAAEDERVFREHGIAASGAMRFEREGKRPDGSAVKLAFSLVFARDPLASKVGFAVSHNHFPENFWNPAFQRHSNGVTGVAGVVLVAENPTDHHIFMSAFAGERELQSTSSGISIVTPRGEIQIMDPTAYRRHFGIEPPNVNEGMRLCALRLMALDLGHVEASLKTGGTPYSAHMGRIVIEPAQAMGVALVFERPPATSGR